MYKKILVFFEGLKKETETPAEIFMTILSIYLEVVYFKVNRPLSVYEFDANVTVC